MGKYDFIKTENIVSVHKTIKVQYETGYGGEVKDVEVRVYPYTVEEKLELSNLNKEAEKLLKGTQEEKEKGIKLAEEVGIKTLLFVLRKDDPEVTEEIVKKIPKDWQNEIAYTALEFEGLSREELKARAKKEIDKFPA